MARSFIRASIPASAHPVEEYPGILSRVILSAKKIGMEFRLYDENGWPSGTVGGALLRQYPGDAQPWADLISEPPADAADLLGIFMAAIGSKYGDTSL